MLLAPCVLFGLDAGAAPPVLEPGNWMFSIESTTNGRREPPMVAEDCLDEQLKDLGAYFAPKLEGAEARCETTRNAESERVMAYRMQCKGAGFTATSTVRVTIEDSRRVTLRSVLETKTLQGDSMVVAAGEALRTGACRRK